MIAKIPVVDRNTWIIFPSSLGEVLPSHYELLEVDDFIFARCSDGRFEQDRCLVSSESYALLIDGVILNKAELLVEYGHTSLVKMIEALIREHGIQKTLAKLRGPFSGAVLDRPAQVLHSFGNQTGESAAFFYAGVNGPIFSNSFDSIMRILKHSNIPISFDQHAALMMLSYGFMIDDHTFATEIRRVAPGSVTSCDFRLGESTSETYWSLKNVTLGGVDSIEEAVDQLDQLFRQAVKRCFEKDLEYGFQRHLVDLSGGLDARMVNVVARDLGYASITNVTYSESKTPENRYAVRVATQLGNDCIYHPLDGGRSALNPEQNLRLNSGMAFYSGITGGAFLLKSLNFTEFGLEHTGQIGGPVVGTYATSLTRHPPAPGAGAYSRVNIYPVDMQWDDEELFLMNTRAFRGSTSSHLLRQHFTFAVSPYSDVDLLDFMFSLPLKWRLNHKLFALWIQRCYPWALDVPSTRFLPFRVDPVRSTILFARKAMGAVARRAQNWLDQRGIPGSTTLSKLGFSMNPVESWFAVNAELRKIVEDSRQLAAKIPANRELQDSFDRSFGKRSATWDKLLAVTVVTMHSMYFSDNQEQTHS